MPKTTLDMSSIKKSGQSKKITFTKSTSSGDLQLKLKEKFPFLEKADGRYFLLDYNTKYMCTLKLIEMSTMSHMGIGVLNFIAGS